MDKKFKMKFSKSIIVISIILWIAIAALLVFTVIDMITMSGFDAGRLISVIALSVVFSIVIATLYKSNYKILPDGVEINISILRYKIDILPLFSVKYQKVDNSLVLSYFDNKENVKKHFVQIDEIEFKRFADGLKEVKPSIIYEEES